MVEALAWVVVEALLLGLAVVEFVDGAEETCVPEAVLAGAVVLEPAPVDTRTRVKQGQQKTGRKEGHARTGTTL